MVGDALGARHEASDSHLLVLTPDDLAQGMGLERADHCHAARLIYDRVRDRAARVESTPHPLGDRDGRGTYHIRRVVEICHEVVRMPYEVERMPRELLTM